MRRKLLTHVQSRYATDQMSRKVSTICGKDITRKNARRFKSDVNPDIGCLRCLRRVEQ